MSKSHVVVEGKSKVLQNAPWHSAILLTGIKRLLVLKFFRGGGVFFEWPLKTGFTVCFFYLLFLLLLPCTVRFCAGSLFCGI